MNRSIALIIALLGYQLATAQIIATIAGTGIIGYNGDGGPATAAQIKTALGVCTDSKGAVYFTDITRVRKISAGGYISTVAGNDSSGFGGDGGPATAAILRNASAMCIDKYSNIYFVDLGNGRVRKIDTNGVISTYCGTGVLGFSGDDGPATAAKINTVSGVAVDTGGNVYLAESINYRLRKIDGAGIISTIAGTGSSSYGGDGGPATAAAFVSLLGVSTDTRGNIYVSDGVNRRVRKIDASGIITTFVGTGVQGYTGNGGPATAAQIDGVSFMANDTAGNLYMVESSIGRIRRVNTLGIIDWIAGDGSVNSYGGDGGPPTAAKFNVMVGIACTKSGSNIYIADKKNFRVRRISYPSTLLTKNSKIITGKISCQPNPVTSGSFAIKVSCPVNEAAQVVVTNVAGQIIQELTTVTNKVTEVPIDAPAGVYLVTATTVHGRWCERVVVAR